MVRTLLHTPKKLILAFGLLFSLSFSGYSGVCVAMVDGNWEDPSIWSCGRLPTCGDFINIPAGITVTITTVLDLESCGSAVEIDVYGELTFQTGKKLSLACGSKVFVHAGGSVTGGGGGGSSNLIDICGTTAWTAGMGDVNGPASISEGGVGPMPVELLYFNAVAHLNSVVKLSWATATETNNSHFIIERSANGIDFSPVNTVPAAGNGNSLITLNYQFTDNSPLGGTSYYRLKQVDRNGEYKYYEIVQVTLSKKASINTYPNPVSSELIISAGDESINAPYQVVNALGMEVLHGTIAANTQSLNVSELNGGVYFLIVNTAAGTEKIKLVVQK